MGRDCTWLATLALAAGAAALTGCSGIGLGGEAIARGRSVYNDVINRTDDEQTLRMIVRTRYGLTTGRLQVRSVTANMKFATHVSAQFPIGADKYSLENLVPLETGVAFEENPTISYIPIRGESAVLSLMAPIDLKTLILITRSVGNRDVFSLLVERVNSLPHPALGQPGGDRFERALEILVDLVAAGVADWGKLPGADDFQLIVYGYAQRRAQVAELFDLLSLAPPPASGDDVQLPLRLAVGSPDGRSVQVRTRSVYDLVLIAAASIDVPATHSQANLVAPLSAELQAMSTALSVKSSVDAPEDAVVAVPHNGYWYYIDPTDHRTKLLFRVIQGLFELRLSDTHPEQGTPVLTVPVG